MYVNSCAHYAHHICHGRHPHSKERQKEKNTLCVLNLQCLLLKTILRTTVGWTLLEEEEEEEEEVEEEPQFEERKDVQ